MAFSYSNFSSHTSKEKNRLPPELLREIVKFYSTQNTTLDTQDHAISSKPPWQLFSSLSSASKALRALALGSWFAIFVVRHVDDLLDSNIPFPEIKTSWTREIHFIRWPKGLQFNIVENFMRLSKIRIDCSKADVVPPRESNGQLLLKDIELEIRNLYWPSPLVTQYISRTFPTLRVLRLRQTRTWCGLCHTCCIPEFQPPLPTVIRYEGGTGLPTHYAQELSSLEYLEAVYLDVGAVASGKTTLASREGRNPDLWIGECDRCIEVMYEDETFRKEWVAKKNNSAVKPPRLTTVEWSFLSKEDFDSSSWSDDSEE
ncbi:hypothetical protein FB446DRAFT_785377 [Lentinula raphanica]|nr:hypothetical protein FB446DRAFT_785377 [Lentinula raphanica]